ncbi:lipoprotein signal peptidase [Pandoraea nosoerga]|uniref:Lipoprotein signal peptidase n=1 Tax=Pandoraea nosoerga TaxID=2508296 RepID=A0A5E4WVQ1_9BURK|nr:MULTISPECIES: signal peptidase II [Pandoraea]MBN4666347.1 lipoprotein signal peptidase [Pandoraea nosoerga]MBN4675974.1 lipoprotein signal peptidase [Pandoraea nosoerga]MBN4682069.1 lipoprotein signal peptidase [Pandoraea nosoerga]MBN4746458.1 lipoprotein signal peptidase [Pandoraea nosoerga]VVE28333.1 peptidase A8 [Pandoraea nosoerga]
MAGKAGARAGARRNGGNGSGARGSAGFGLAPWLGIAVIAILLDQVTKLTILKTFQYGEFRPLTSFFNLVLVYNKGAAFSFLAAAGGWQRWFFTLLGVVAAAVIIWLLKRHHGQKMFCLSLSLILGGALGNVIDRVIYGHVVDFLDFHVGGWHWPAFNVADSAICVGAVLLVIDELRRVRRGK